MTETNTSSKLSLPALLGYCATILVLVGVDQWSKAWVLSKLPEGKAVTVLPHILQFRYVTNTGAAFSVFSGRTLLLAGLTAVILVGAVLLLVLGKIPGRLNQAALVLMVAGGVGNLIDRIARHFVVDFIEVLFTDFAVFNFADCCVTVGAAVLILTTVISFIRELREPKDQR